MTGQTSSNLTRSLDVSLAGYTPVSVEDVEFTPARSGYYQPSGISKSVQDYDGNVFIGYDSTMYVGSNEVESTPMQLQQNNTVTYTSDGARHNTEIYHPNCHYTNDPTKNTTCYTISNDTYNYGKRVVSVTYRKNS